MKKFLLIMALMVLITGAAMATDGNLPGGTSISVSITAPPDGALKVYPPGDVDLAGDASVGAGVAVPNTLIVYVVDVSFSTVRGDGGTGCGGDQNGDGISDTILDCELFAARTLNDASIVTGTVGDVGLAVLGEGGAATDVGPAGGDQLLTGPAMDADGIGGPDIEQVLASAYSTDSPIAGGVKVFTQKEVGSGATNFGDGLSAAVSIASASSKPNKIIVFMSDGLANTGPTVASVSVPSGILIYSFAIGSVSDCTSNPFSLGSLQDVANRGTTGSSCTHVDTPANLPSVIPGIVAAQLTALDYNVDGGAFAPVTTFSPALPWIDPVTGTFGPDLLPGLLPGKHTICAQATGFDGGGTGSVTDCIGVTVASIALNPPTATNELGTPGQTHTVTATVAAGSDGGVSGVPVGFDVLSGPNAGATGSGTTDVSGQAAFTYTAAQGLAGLGTDSIQACFGPDNQGNSACARATKAWVDTTPPVVACPAGPNPSGNVPKAKGGQRPDGFYALTATDAVDPSPSVFLTDTGSGTVFGPFTSVTNIKYTQAPGATPRQEPMSGVVAWHITGTGDAAVYAVDFSGNAASPVSCLVPPPPK